MKAITLTILAVLILSAPLSAAHTEREAYYQGIWCAEHQGITEHVLPDRARVDCLTAEYAIEFDFAYKWAESIGQALYYALMTGKKPGVVLIMEAPGDGRYLERLESVSDRYGISVWTVQGVRE